MREVYCYLLPLQYSTIKKGSQQGLTIEVTDSCVLKIILTNDLDYLKIH